MISIPLRTAIAILRAILATTSLAAGVFGLAQGAVATPAALADGSEIVVTDGDGDRLLGYGRVEGAVLRLSLAVHDDGGLAVMVIDPDGRVSTMVGRFAADGLRVRGQGASEDVTLLSWLSERGVKLTLETAGRSSDDDDGDRGDSDRDDGDQDARDQDGGDQDDGADERVDEVDDAGEDAATDDGDPDESDSDDGEPDDATDDADGGDADGGDASVDPDDADDDAEA